MTDNVLEFDPAKKKPYVIDRVLPWPPSDGLMKDMENGLIEKATFELRLALAKKEGKSQDEVMRDLEAKRRL